MTMLSIGDRKIELAPRRKPYGWRTVEVAPHTGEYRRKLRRKLFWRDVMFGLTLVAIFALVFVGCFLISIHAL